jgi:hypothetical protein
LSAIAARQKLAAVFGEQAHAGQRTLDLMIDTDDHASDRCHLRGMDQCFLASGAFAFCLQLDLQQLLDVRMQLLDERAGGN